MASSIGIKIANGDFYPLIEENSPAKKRLVLTTVHNKQRSVQIDLYRSFTQTMADAQYIGSLVVEDIKPRSKGEPSIEMIISSTEGGEITAEAADLDTSSEGLRQSLNVSLKSLDEDNRDMELPDFDLEQENHPPQGLYEKAEAAKEKKTRKFPWLLVILLILFLALGGLLAVWFFVYGGASPREWLFPGKTAVSEEPAWQPVPAVPPPPAAAPAPAQTAPPQAVQAVPPQAVQAVPPPASPPPQAAPVQPRVIQAPSVPVQTAPAVRARPTPPVASYRVPATIPREGVAYKIRWGDTLWDISEAFYRNPWLYPRIARFNNIRNPDLIISGRTIRIPPRN